MLDHSNWRNLQLDLLITPKDFLFRCFDKIVNVSPASKGVDAHLKDARGAMSSMHKFTLTDLPYLNPFDWISLLLLLLKDQHKFEPIISHPKRMLVCYIQEVGKIGV
ncbi:unnamed protein product [Lactuca saligna]|uniref:Uncharacterized protein n=1 Tax=Lactuca saligna TaxID=75948 RepID=A0AA35W0E1_LACSI|nr:unnamed protein product [Lactuca saligna]